LSGSYDVERKIGVFSDIGDIVDAMKAYAGVAIRKTEGIIANIREYERNVLLALADVMSSDETGLFEETSGAKGLVVAFGSSQGLCGAYNEKLAETLSGLVKREDSLYVVGRRLKTTLESRRITPDAFQESIAGPGGLEQAWRDCISCLPELYRKGGFYALTLVFTAVSGQKAEISTERLLPPPICGLKREAGNQATPIIYLEKGRLFDRILEEFISIGVYRGLTESLRSENWYRLRSMEGASENIKRHISDLESLRRYLRQEEITGELLEILGSGGFYGRL
jgi:F-type H+-transporting ATPase subunit gamma